MNNENLNLFLQPVSDTPVIPLEGKRLLTAIKSDLSLMVSQIVEAVDDGTADALDTAIIAKKMNYVSEGVIEAMKGKAKIPNEKDYSKYNVAIREQTTGARYTFDGCNDPRWNELNGEMILLKDKIADREAWLKTITKPVMVDDEAIEETGEVIPSHMVYPPVKTGQQSLIYTLK